MRSFQDSDKRKRVVEILRAVNTYKINDHSENVHVSCLFAPYTGKHKNSVDRSPSMGILIREDDESLVHCFACEWKGTLSKMIRELASYDQERFGPYVAEILELERINVLAKLAEMRAYGMWSGKVQEEVPKKVHPVFLEEDYDPFRGWYHPYLKKRGITIETAKVWEAGWDDRHKRVMFPVRDVARQLVGAVGRAVHDQTDIKYFGYWDFDRGGFLFGEHLYQPGTALVVVEGVLDTVLGWQHLLPVQEDYSIVCTQGIDVTDEQIDKAVMLASEIIVAYDDDPEGRRGVEKFLGKAKRRAMVKVADYSLLRGNLRYAAQVAKGKLDPGCLTPEDFVSLIVNATFQF